MAKVSALSRAICSVCPHSLICLTKTPRQIIHTMEMFDDKGGLFRCNGFPSGAEVKIDVEWAVLDPVIDKFTHLVWQEARGELDEKFRTFQPWGGR